MRSFNLSHIVTLAVDAGGVFGGAEAAAATPPPAAPAAAPGLSPTPPLDSAKPPPGASATAAAPAPTSGVTTLSATGAVAAQPTNPTDTPKGEGGPAASPLGSVKAEAKPADGAKAEGAKPADAKPFEIKVPDGVQVDAAVLKDFTAVAQKHGLTPEAASELVAWEAKRAAVETEKWNQLPLEDRIGAVLEQQEKVWEKELRADKEFGGTRFDDNIKLAHRALTRFPGGVELAHELDAMGFGYHPRLVKWLANIGQGLTEGNANVPGATTAGKKTARELAQERYPNSPELWPK